MPIPSEKLEKFVAWRGIEPGAPANMASALTTELPNREQISLKLFMATMVKERSSIMSAWFFLEGESEPKSEKFAYAILEHILGYSHQIR